MFERPSRHAKSYLRAGRLADVLALIQVLALDEHAHRQEGSIKEKTGLRHELQGPPISAKTWAHVARRHPEFFRVHKEVEHGISLVARHVLPKKDGRRDLPPEIIGRLFDAAIELHDRQVRLAERWTYLIPIAAALVASLGAILVSLR